MNDKIPIEDTSVRQPSPLSYIQGETNQANGAPLKDEQTESPGLPGYQPYGGVDDVRSSRNLGLRRESPLKRCRAARGSLPHAATLASRPVWMPRACRRRPPPLLALARKRRSLRRYGPHQAQSTHLSDVFRFHQLPMLYPVLPRRVHPRRTPHTSGLRPARRRTTR